MQLEYLEYFSKIEQGVSLNVLSRKLHISQQGLSAAIKALEQEMGCQLLIRTGKGVYFTENGMQLAEQTRIYFEKIHEIKVNAGKQLSGKITVPVMAGAISTSLAEKLKKFMEENPLVSVEFFYNSSPDECLQYIENGRAELVLGMNIVIGNGNNQYSLKAFRILPTDYEFCEIKTVETCIECHRDMLKSNKVVSLCELSSYKCIGYPYNGGTNFLQEILTQCRCASPLSMEWSYELYHEQLLNKKGYGLASSPQHWYKHSDEELIYVPLKDKIKMRIGYIVKRNQALSLLGQRLVEYLQS